MSDKLHPAAVEAAEKRAVRLLGKPPHQGEKHWAYELIVKSSGAEIHSAIEAHLQSEGWLELRERVQYHADHCDRCTGTGSTREGACSLCIFDRQALRRVRGEK